MYTTAAMEVGDTELERRDNTRVAFERAAASPAFTAILKRVCDEYDKLPLEISEDGTLFPTFWQLARKELSVRRRACCPLRANPRPSPATVSDSGVLHVPWNRD